jgi:hypothetical protein
MIGPIFYEVNVLGLNEILSSIPPDKDARRQDKMVSTGHPHKDRLWGHGIKAKFN